MKEEFRIIEGFEDYQISNHGRVYSSRYDRFLKPYVNGRGYLHACLCVKMERSCKAIHQLVAIAFLGHNPCGMKLVVDHIDNNKLNNRVDNLQIITTRQNIIKGIKYKSSKHTGVYWDKRMNKWRSKIEINNKQIHLGYFDCELETSKYYQIAIKIIDQYQNPKQFRNLIKTQSSL